jgi:hypothetical protein
MYLTVKAAFIKKNNLKTENKYNFRGIKNFKTSWIEREWIELVNKIT